MNSKKIAYIQSVINQLAQEKDHVTLHEIAEAAQLDKASATDRRAIQRALSNLIASNQMEARGDARARVYIKKTTIQPQKKLIIKNIPYRADFLTSYTPNETIYLPHELREKLREMGLVESTIRPAGTYARKILNRLLIDLSWNSSRLEGNTYSLLETKQLIEQHKSAPEKDPAETQMILNHKNAIEFILALASEEQISALDVRSIHALLSENLLGDPGASGRIRNIGVQVSGTRYMPLDNPHLLKEYFELFIQKFNLIHDPFEQSFFSLVHLSYLQAFEDVNKRTSRLVANISLIKNNLRPLSFIGVDQETYVSALLTIYEKNEIDSLCNFYWEAYQKSAQHYSAIQKTAGVPDTLKIRYYDKIHDIVRYIILQNISMTDAAAVIVMKLSDLPITEKEKLIQIIETEIACLHEGNVARFKIRPSEFQKWQNKNQ